MAVTQESIKKRITKTDFYRLPESTVTVCSITLENGFSVRGESACVNPADFDKDKGEELAYADAFRKIWPLEGYLAAERRWRSI